MSTEGALLMGVFPLAPLTLLFYLPLSLSLPLCIPLYLFHGLLCPRYVNSLPSKCVFGSHGFCDLEEVVC